MLLAISYWSTLFIKLTNFAITHKLYRTLSIFQAENERTNWPWLSKRKENNSFKLCNTGTKSKIEKNALHNRANYKIDQNCRNTWKMHTHQSWWLRRNKSHRLPLALISLIYYMHGIESFTQQNEHRNLVQANEFVAVNRKHMKCKKINT